MKLGVPRKVYRAGFSMILLGLQLCSQAVGWPPVKITLALILEAKDLEQICYSMNNLFGLYMDMFNHNRPMMPNNYAGALPTSGILGPNVPMRPLGPQVRFVLSGPELNDLVSLHNYQHFQEPDGPKLQAAISSHTWCPFFSCAGY